ncbi:TPA: pheST operon leader peptide PheM [Salmonella enterica]|nr:pheST operon leader peptide PheM [Escherichia coli]EMD2984597.1 pheST operon leader peptide PheM [Salmonella enterica]EHK2827142.1 pheST operon leader peptide PheM [Escherichia coli]EMD3452636.1 pheST operon leader peptide PheM [Salmonella enterica]EMD3625399.1 pheST operon leader peptide PheM [Salmonella enterica]EMD3709607.1 pheST operon leader peptide PheM [Salmonella enterica]
MNAAVFRFFFYFST